MSGRQSWKFSVAIARHGVEAYTPAPRQVEGCHS